MSIPIWYLAAGAPFLMSLGYLAGEIVAYVTTKELEAAWMLLALRVQDFLATRRAGVEPFDQDEIIPLREAIQLLEDLHELPKAAAGASPARCA